MHIRRFLFTLFAIVALSPPFLAAQVKTSGTIPSAGGGASCVSINVDAQATVAIQVAGTWTGTLQPKISVQGQSAANIQVTPSTSTTPASTITANGVYRSSVAGGSTFLVCGNTVASGTANIYLNATTASAGSGGIGAGGAVASVFGRTGAVGAQTGDYSCGQVTGCTGPILNALAYGAVGDNSTDNSTAFAALAAAANAVTLTSGGNGFATVYLPYGTYKYASGLSFTQNVAIKCEPGATFSYTGSAHAADMGPTGLVAWARSTSFYTIEGCTWTGGASMTEGLFFPAFVGFPRVTRNSFYDFGNATSTVYQIWFDTDNYSVIVDHNFIDNDDLVARNHLKINNSNGNGNSLLDYHDNYLISIQDGHQTGFSSGVGVWADGSQSQIHDNDFNWGAPNIRFGNFCQGCYAHDNYMETLASTAAVEVGTPSTANCPDGVTIQKSYFNGHSTAWLVGPSASNTGICTNMVVDDITLVGYPAATPLVKVNTGTTLKSNSISNVGGLPSPPVTSGSSDVWRIQYKPGSTDPIAGTDVWAIGGISASTVDRLSFNVNGGQPILSINDTNNAITTMAATQSTVGGAAGTFTNHPYALRTNNVDRMTFDISGNALFNGPNGSNAQKSYFGCETSNAATTLSTVATTTNTGLNCLPINAVIDAVVYRITTTITTAATFQIGDATTSGRFSGALSATPCGGAGLTAGSTGICFVQADQTGASGPRQTAAAAVRVTTNVNPGAGAIRLIVYYHTWTAPTS